MWSGPRNLSTAMMRSFGNRADCAAVRDEPFYAAYLAASGKEHPMRAEVLASQPQDWRAVARACASGEVPPGRILYQKHMTHHMLPGFGLDWMDARRPRLPDPRAGAGGGELCGQARGGDARRPRLRPAGRALRPGGAARRRARRRSSTPRRSAPIRRACCAGSAPRSGLAFDAGDAGLAGRSARERRGLGGALVRRGERLDRLRAAGAGAAAAAGRDARHRRGRPAGLRAPPAHAL